MAAARTDPTLGPRRTDHPATPVAARRARHRKDNDMLGESPISPVLLAKDLAAAKTFYHDQLGLEILSESDYSLVFRCGGTELAVSKSTTGTADEQTQVSWKVKDLPAELDYLRSRGVKVEDYDTPELTTKDGIADIGFAWMAWIIDPGKNALAIMQIKD
jgi:catechol 2,3-dioxygenase-like lactoylglutathione lyase family enzyme